MIWDKKKDMITMMVYNLHCAHTPKENVKYFRLAPLNKYFDIDKKDNEGDI